MSRFSHAYRGVLKQAGISISDAARLSGIPQSSISRFLAGDRPVYAEHVAALIRALPDRSDREHCVLEFLHDQCPPELAGRLVAHFGTAQEPRMPPRNIGDDLDEAVQAIRRAARAGNVYARKVVINLARAVDPDPPDANSRLSGGGPAHTLSA